MLSGPQFAVGEEKAINDFIADVQSALRTISFSERDSSLAFLIATVRNRLVLHYCKSSCKR